MALWDCGDDGRVVWCGVQIPGLQNYTYIPPQEQTGNNPDS